MDKIEAIKEMLERHHKTGFAPSIWKNQNGYYSTHGGDGYVILDNSQGIQQGYLEMTPEELAKKI